MTQQADELKQGIETVENTIDDNAEMDAEEQEILDAELIVGSGVIRI